MTHVIESQVAGAVRRAAVRATLAPSVHNTQPWRFVLSDTTLEVYADWSRQLRVLDPRGRQLLISCGCAVFNARVALAASGYAPTVERFPDADQPDLLARIGLTEPDRPIDAIGLDPGIGALELMIELRHTNRRRFSDEPVPDEVVDALVRIAADDGADLVAVTRPDDRQAVARLNQQADDLENIDPAYRAELRAWTSDDPLRLDGVPAGAVPHVGPETHDEVPIRDFDTHGHGALPAATHSSSDQCMLLLGTANDSPLAWLQAGEALEHVLLELTRRGYVASPLTQLIEVATTNAGLRRDLRLTMNPHLLLRIGRAPATPATRRRRLVDLLGESGRQ